MKAVTNKFGFFTALAAFLAASGYCIVQLLQVFKLIAFPTDAILIYSFSLAIAIPFMFSILALHHSVPDNKRLWTHASLLMAVLYAAYASLVYVVQLATVVPRMIGNSSDSVQVLIMNPHSFPWSLDALTYICLGLCTLFGGLAFERGRVARWFFFANALMTPVIAFVYFYPRFSTSLLWVACPWIITAPGSMLLLALYFKRKRTVSIKEMDHQYAELVEVWEE